MYLQKVTSFVGLKIKDENSRVRSQIRIQRHAPRIRIRTQNVTDPQQCIKQYPTLSPDGISIVSILMLKIILFFL
jgi:hypothetical protein